MTMYWTTVSLALLSLFFIPDGCLAQRKLSRNVAVAASEVKASINFDCPEEFGYYPHPTDCTQYYVCVFGGALLESCTGGLMYSHELQTCDWPRNVGCDANLGGEVAQSAPVATAAPINRGRGEQSDHEPPIRSRYSITSAVPSPLPQPPQPAPVVTSRGQSRQLHHQQQQQQLTKQQQQQQLYEDAEEQLPPAEEIETDRQQRVYRGQPSTLGQVQRDRDGLRHSNAIPYNGRSEKIGVISFGTHQTQPQAIQQYRDIHDNDVEDNLDLTAKRRKRQIERRPPESSAWHGSKATYAPIPKSIYNFHPPPPSLSVPLHKSPFLSYQQKPPTDIFRPSIPSNEDSFQPFMPPHELNKHNQTSNKYQFININHDQIQAFGPSDRQPEHYALLGFVGSKSSSARPIPKSTYTPNKSHFQKHTKYHLDHFTPSQMQNHVPQIKNEVTQAIAEGFKPLQEYHSYKGLQVSPLRFSGIKEVKPDFLSPPVMMNVIKSKFALQNNYGSSNFDFEKFLESIRNEQITTKRPAVPTIPPIVLSSTKATIERPTTTNAEDYYYDEEDDKTQQPPVLYNHKEKYSSQDLKSSKPPKPTVPIPIHKPLREDEEYYYEEYDYVLPTKTQLHNNSSSVKYSARYQEKNPYRQHIIQKVTETTTITYPVGTSSLIAVINSSFTTSAPISSSLIPVPAKTTTQKSVYTIRQRNKSTTTNPTVRSVKIRQRLTTPTTILKNSADYHRTNKKHSNR